MKTAPHPWKQLLRQGLGLFVQQTCPLCDRSSRSCLCPDCQQRLSHCCHPQPWRDRAPTAPDPDSLPLFAWGAYEGELKRAIAALKYEAQPQLAVPLGEWMAAAWKRHPAPRSLSLPGLVVPIPLHPSKQRERGFNQAETLARSFCAIAGLPLAPHGLRRTRATEAQFRLSSAERQTNLAQAFAVGESLRQRPPRHPVLLFDDIYTTGATIRAATAVLRSQGIRVTGVIVLASTRAALTGG